MQRAELRAAELPAGGRRLRGKGRRLHPLDCPVGEAAVAVEPRDRLHRRGAGDATRVIDEARLGRVRPRRTLRGQQLTQLVRRQRASHKQHAVAPRLRGRRVGAVVAARTASVAARRGGQSVDERAQHPAV